MSRVICPEPGVQLTIPSGTANDPNLPSYTVVFASTSNGRESVEEVAERVIRALAQHDPALAFHFAQRLDAARFR